MDNTGMDHGIFLWHVCYAKRYGIVNFLLFCSSIQAFLRFLPAIKFRRYFNITRFIV